MTAAPKKILPLESLRGIAALCVALHHVHTQSPLTENAFIAHANLMVDLFFVLSGYVIAHSYVDRLTTVSAVVAFQRKRFWRLYPLHLVMFAVFVGIETSRLLYVHLTKVTLPLAPFSQNDAGAALNNLLLTQALLEKQTTFNFPSWSISVEFYTYLVFALLVLCLQRKAWIGFMAGVIVALLAQRHVPDVFSLMTGAAFLRCAYGFFLGAIAQRVVSRAARPSGPATAGLVLLAAVLAEIYLPLTRFQLAVAPLFALAVGLLAALPPSRPLARLLSMPQLVFLGTISYSVYMCHAAVWWILTQMLRVGLHIPEAIDSDGIARLELTPLQGSFLAIGGLVLIVGISRCTFTWIEDRCRHGLLKRRESRTAPRPELAAPAGEPDYIARPTT